MSYDDYNIQAAQNAQISGNTEPAGGGTEYRLVVDANGYLQVEIVGGAGSYPYNPETDDDNIPIGEVRETVIAILYAKDPGGNMERVLTDGAGKIQTTATVIAPGAYNAETDDDSVPAGEDHESNIVLTHGYDPVGTDWERIHSDSAHGLLVSNTNFGTMNTSLNNIETDAAAIEVLITAGNVDLAAMEALLITIDADTSLMVPDLDAIRVDAAAIEVLITAGNVDLAAIEALQITIDASLNEIEDAIENLEEALSSIATDHLLIGDGAAIINLDGAGDVQVDVLTMPVVAVTGTFWQVTQPISAAALPLPAGASTSAIQATMNTSLDEIEDAIENLEEALASIGTDHLIVGDGAAIINLDGAGDVQVDVLTMPVVAVTGTFWQVTQPISAAALPLPAGASTSANQTILETTLTNLEEALQSIGTDHLLIGDAGSIINLDAAGDVQVDVLTMPVVAVTGTFWQVTQPVSLATDVRYTATSDAVPDLDGVDLLPVHSLVSARKDVDTTIGITATDGTYNALHVRLTDGTNFPNIIQLTSSAVTLENTHALIVAAEIYARIDDATLTGMRMMATPFGALTTQDALVVTSVVHGEDLDVGAGNSEPIKIRTEDGALPYGEKHHVTTGLLYGDDGTDWHRLRCDANGYLIVYTP